MSKHENLDTLKSTILPPKLSPIDTSALASLSTQPATSSLTAALDRYASTRTITTNSSSHRPSTTSFSGLHAKPKKREYGRPPSPTIEEDPTSEPEPQASASAPFATKTARLTRTEVAQAHHRASHDLSPTEPIRGLPTREYNPLSESPKYSIFEGPPKVQIHHTRPPCLSNDEIHPWPMRRHPYPPQPQLRTRPLFGHHSEALHHRTLALILDLVNEHHTHRPQQMLDLHVIRELQEQLPPFPLIEHHECLKCHWCPVCLATISTETGEPLPSETEPTSPSPNDSSSPTRRRGGILTQLFGF